ncbi:MAG: hypothetical protein GY812_00265 [Actinomycetia bacterium]|nr:hypothetical protein [Actinomycetes bacterium]
MELEPDDPVVQRRAQILRATSLGQRFGYTCFALSMLLFFIGLVLQFPQWLVTTIVVLMVAGSIVLLPAIIFSYAAKAADKLDDHDDREGWR